MASKSYHIRALVLKKTRLGESDIIFTMLGEDGAQYKAVGKGARKPQSPFSSRLELFSVADLLCAHGKSLDIVSEARLIEAHDNLRRDFGLTLYASPVAELLAKTTQPGLEQEKLFDATIAGLDALNESDPSCGLSLCAAMLLKTLAFSGFCPSLINCISCERPVSTDGAGPGDVTYFSYTDGGVVCPACERKVSGVYVSTEALALARALMYGTYADLSSKSFDPDVATEVLRMAQGLIHAQTGCSLKSLEMIFAGPGM
ncbi:MAG: DNA repair protein RecO [Eggerthellaceae bacterium]|nr:DNA repair protein RecO [Eggerthellaceae bacterium]